MATETSRLLPDSSPANNPKPNNYAIKLFSVSALVSVIVIVVLVLYYRPNPRKDHFVLTKGNNIQILSEKYQLFLRSDPLKVGKIALSDDIPWLHGSTFEQFHVDGECFALKTLSGSWLVLDRKTSSISPEEVDGIHATQFEVVFSDDSPNQTKKGKSAKLKVCKEDLWWEVVEQKNVNTVDSASYLTVLARRPVLDRKVIPLDRSVPSENVALEGLFRVRIVEPIHGVNLGGWFIPEIWMNPSFSNYTGLHWAGSLCK